MNSEASHPAAAVRERGSAPLLFPGRQVLLVLGGTAALLSQQGHARRKVGQRAIPAAPIAVAVGGAVLVAAAVTVTRRSPEPKELPDIEDIREAQRQTAEELRSLLPSSLEEALKDFDGDFSGPWQALGLEASDPSITMDDIRMAYRQAVRLEHPDTSEYPDAEERFQRVRKAYALLSDEGSRELLLEAIEQEASSFEELSGVDLVREDEGEETSFPWCLVLLLAVLGVLFLAVVVSLSSPEMQLRPTPKEPAVYLLDKSNKP